jgi:hypothetical protein
MLAPAEAETIVGPEKDRGFAVPPLDFAMLPPTKPMLPDVVVNGPEKFELLLVKGP